MVTTFKSTVQIGPVEIGDRWPAPIVAEIGGNHGGRLELALQMIDAAQGAGARAVKFQIYDPASFLSKDSAYYSELAAEQLKPAQWPAVWSHAQEKGLICLASVFDFVSLEIVARLDCPAVKIASGDLNNFPLLEAAADLNRPIILSSGAGEQDEVDQALDFLAHLGVEQLILMQCTALYPCPDDEVNLSVISTWRKRYGLPIGFSDHSPGVEIPLGALSLGASLVEKHFTTDRALPGGDNAMSCLPSELAFLVHGAERLAFARGRAEKHPTAGERPIRPAIRRSIVAARPVKAGETLSCENLALKRPGLGLAPAEYYRLLGRTASMDLAEDEPFTWEKVV